MISGRAAMARLPVVFLAAALSSWAGCREERDGRSHVPRRSSLGAGLDAGAASGDGGGDCTACAGASADAGFRAEVASRYELSSDCPLVGGLARAEVSLGGQALGTASDCPDCGGGAQGEAKLDGKLALCQPEGGAHAFAIAGRGALDVSRRGCVDQARDGCPSACSASHCTKSTASAKGRLTASAFYPFRLQFAAPGRFGVHMDVRCGVTVRGAVDVSASYAGTDDGGCAPCTSCAETTGEVASKVSGRGGCGTDLRLGPWSEDLGCAQCADLEIEATGKAAVARGACPGEDCRQLRVATSAKVTYKTRCVRMGWYKVRLLCAVKAAGQCDRDTCGDSACKDEGTISCAVAGTC